MLKNPYILFVINHKHQLILLEMLWLYAVKKRHLERSDIIKEFSNDGDFYKHIKDLIEFGYIKNEGNGSYCFLSNGWAFANILGLQPNTEKRYRQVAIEITWLP
jgi:predicted transcriptional regulator